LHIPDRTFAILGCVALFQVTNPLAREFTACNTKPFRNSFLFRAIFYRTDIAMINFFTFGITSYTAILVPLESEAEVTNHPTRGNAFSIHLVTLHPFPSTGSG
jgi:hypothetical protein